MKKSKSTHFWSNLLNIFKRKNISDKSENIVESKEYDIDWEAIPVQ
jgi:hypothetical protein